MRVINEIIEKINRLETLLFTPVAGKKLSELYKATQDSFEAIHNEFEKHFVLADEEDFSFHFDNKYTLDKAYIDCLKEHAYRAEDMRLLKFYEDAEEILNNVQGPEKLKEAYNKIKTEIDSIFDLNSVKGRFIDLMIIMGVATKLKGFEQKVEPAYKLFKIALNNNANAVDKASLEAIFKQGAVEAYISLGQFNQRVEEFLKPQSAVANNSAQLKAKSFTN